MREIRPYGSEGGGAEANRLSLPLSAWQSLASSGFLLGAYGAEELTPSRWHESSKPRTPRHAHASLNGDGE